MIRTILGGAAGIIAAPTVGGLVWRKVRQRQVAKALEITTPNRIVEQGFVKVGGIDQWIQVRGEDRDNPVLLLLHGGPGWPNAVFTLPLRPWERHFTVVQWDHRGAGKTLRRTGRAGSGEMTFDRRVADAVELIDFLRRRLDKDQVVVLAESMGTLTGLPLAKRRPDLLAALVVTDLYVNMAANEARKYQLTLERLRAAGNPKGVAALERIGPDPTRWNLKDWNANMAWAFKTNVPTPNLDRRLLFPLALTSPIYSLRDLYSLFTGFQRSTAQMFTELMAYDAWRLGLRFEIPFFLFQGQTDVITLTTLAEDYFAEVEAPTKGLALIPEAGHFAAFTQPKRFLAELLTRVHPLTAVPSPYPCGNPDAAASSRAAGGTLAASRRVLGDDHPDTLTTMNNLAAVRWEP
jgi:pimeloyl-ACP methyl ester carboxylesterase